MSYPLWVGQALTWMASVYCVFPGQLTYRSLACTFEEIVEYNRPLPANSQQLGLIIIFIVLVE